jgi:predicted ATP-grasp superfamily ATP-dependent carboligase
VGLTVVVTDGEQRSALATVRSLGKAGYSVHVCASRSNSIAGASRYCASQIVVADPLLSPEGFASNLVRLAHDKKADVLLPVTEASLLAVLPRRERFSCVVPFPTADAFERVCNKREVLEKAAARGLSVPTQIEIASVGERNRLDRVPDFPVVLKPTRSVSGPEGGRVRAGVAYASDNSELHSALNRFPPAAYPILVQQRLAGTGFGISILLWDGELRAAFAHRRIREKPPSGGVSVLRESIPLDHALLSRCINLLRDFNWQGVAMVEFKRDDKSGAPYLMEINGRLWGSLQLAIDAGVDFPNLLVQSALGMNPAPATSYRTGVKSRWEWGDVDQLLSTVLHPKKALARSTSIPNRPRLNAFADFFRAFSSDNFPEVFRYDDPVPFFQETVNWFRGR